MMHKEKENNVKEPLVSIGLAVRNGDKYLRAAIDSLLSQTHQNFELVISDNASTDETQKICEEYIHKDSRIRYIRQDEDLGGYRNYDFVRRAARGDYFMWATHDDKWNKRFIEKCLAKFKEDPKAVVAFANFDAFYNSGRKIKHSSEQYFPFGGNLYTRLKAYILLRSSQGKIEMIYGLWKPQVLTDMFSENEFYSDMNFVFRMLFAGHFAFINEALFFKRASAGFQYIPKTKREKIIKVVKSFILFFLDRLRTAISPKVSYLDCKYIFRSAALTPSEKMKLGLWEFFAYLRSIWYGHM